MDGGPTALFDSYESDFKQIVSSIRTKLDGDVKDQTGGKDPRLGAVTASIVLRLRSIEQTLTINSVHRCRAAEGDVEESGQGGGRGRRDSTCDPTLCDVAGLQ